jgi:hypothetical protein
MSVDVCHPNLSLPSLTISPPFPDHVNGKMGDYNKMFQGKCNENPKPKTSVPNDNPFVTYLSKQKTAQHWFFPKHKGMFLRPRTMAHT